MHHRLLFESDTEWVRPCQQASLRLRSQVLSLENVPTTGSASQLWKSGPCLLCCSLMSFLLLFGEAHQLTTAGLLFIQSSHLTQFLVHMAQNIFFFFFALLCSMQDLSYLTKEQTHIPFSGSAESQPLDHQGIPSEHS